MKFKSNISHNISIYNHLWNWNQSFNYTPLITAVLYGHKEIVEHLLSKPNIDINIKDILIQKYPWNLYFFRLYFNLKSFLKLKKKNIYKTAIDYAKIQNHTEIVELLFNEPKYHEGWNILTPTSMIK